MGGGHAPPRALGGLVAVMLIASTSVLAARLGADSEPEYPPPLATGAAAAPTTSPTILAERSSVKGTTSPPRRGRSARTHRAAPDPTPSATERNRFPLKVKVEPPCASRGQPLTATVTSVPTANVGIGVSYADSRSHNTWHVGQTDSEGKLSFTWVVHPEAAEGEGTVLVAASHYKHGSGATSATFRVAKLGGCD